MESDLNEIQDVGVIQQSPSGFDGHHQKLTRSIRSTKLGFERKGFDWQLDENNKQY